MTADELRRRQRGYDELLAQTERAREARDRAIVAALGARMRQSEIMEATGLSRGRLAQIRRGTR